MQKQSKKIKHVMIALLLLLCMLPVQRIEAAPYEYESEVPVFIVATYDGEQLDPIGTTAFYVQDTHRTGGTYLITDSLVESFIDRGKTLVVMSENYYSVVTKTYTDGCFSYLLVEDTEGLENYKPMQMAESCVETDCIMAYLELNEENGYSLMYEYDMDISGWKKEDGYYNSGLVEGTDIELSEIIMLLGMPVMTEEWQVMGVMALNGYDDYLIIQDLTTTDFLPNAMLKPNEVQTETESTEITTETEEVQETEADNKEEKKNDTDEKKEIPIVWIAGIAGAVVLIIVIVVIILIKKKKKEPVIEDTTPVEEQIVEEIPPAPIADIGKTVAMDMDATADLNQTKETEHEVIQKQSNWQLRGMSGRFEGEIFEIEQSLRLGRSAEADISFLQNTRGISNMHCEVKEEFGQVILMDLESSFGTFVGNGRKLEPRVKYQLKEGDIFYLADKEQRFRLEKTGETRGEFTPAVKSVVYPEKDMIYRAGADERLNFGRSPHSQVPFGEENSAISSSHCVLYRDNGVVYLTDLGSTNGTYMGDGRRLKPHQPYAVQKGDAFFLASKKYMFVIVED